MKISLEVLGVPIRLPISLHLGLLRFCLVHGLLIFRQRSQRRATPLGLRCHDDKVKSGKDSREMRVCMFNVGVGDHLTGFFVGIGGASPFLLLMLACAIEASIC